MNEEPATPKAKLVRQASDLPVLLSTLQVHLETVRQNSSLIPESLHQELDFVLEETLSDAQDLVRLVAVQQQLTGLDPLDPSAKTGRSPSTEEEYDEFDETSYNEPEEPLSDEAKQLLMSVFAAYDSLNSKQVRQQWLHTTACGHSMPAYTHLRQLLCCSTSGLS